VADAFAPRLVLEEVSNEAGAEDFIIEGELDGLVIGQVVMRVRKEVEHGRVDVGVDDGLRVFWREMAHDARGDPSGLISNTCPRIRRNRPSHCPSR